MNDQMTRQHYRYALNEPLEKTPKGPHPGYKHGGHVTGFKRMGYKKGGRLHHRLGGRGS